MGGLSIILWALLGFGVFRAVAPRYSADEQRWMTYAYIMHVVFALLHVVVVKYALGGGDMFWYHSAGSALADLWISDPPRWTGELVKLTLRQKAEFPFWIHGAQGGTSTGAMFGISAWLMLLCGKSLYGACVFLSILNFFSRIVIYDVFRRFVEQNYRSYVLWALLLLPSSVFWTAGMIKESVAMTGLGVAVYGAFILAERSAYVRGIGLIALGGFTAYLVKPYVLFPFFVAAPVWYLSAKMTREAHGAAVLLTPLRFVLFGALMIGGLAVLAVAVPSLSVETLGDELASVQSSGARVEGNTNYALVDQDSSATGTRRQLLKAPVGFVFSLTRPWLFEVRSAQTLVAAIESAVLLGFLLLGVRGIGGVTWFRRIIRQPWLLFCAAYVAIFGVAVGLGSTNVGSLSRYRVPMMGFYAVVVALSYAWAFRSKNPNFDDALETMNTAQITTQSGRRRPLRVQNR